MAVKIGIIGIVGEEARHDFWGTMSHLAQLGYKGVESPSGLLDGDVSANISRLHNLGLQVIATSVSREQMTEGLDDVIREASLLQTSQVVCYWGPCETREQLLIDCDMYNRIGSILASEGIRFCYHNHHHELLTSFNGVTALDIMADRTDPANVSFELDVAWLTYGRVDAAAVIRRMGRRVPAIHVKDLVSLEPPPRFTAVGTGVVPIEDAILAANAVGTEWLVIEQDNLRNLNAIETATVSIAILREKGLVK